MPDEPPLLDPKRDHELLGRLLGMQLEAKRKLKHESKLPAFRKF
jgi:hypothetical protein